VLILLPVLFIDNFAALLAGSGKTVTATATFLIRVGFLQAGQMNMTLEEAIGASLVNDTALRILLRRFRVTLYFVDTFYDNSALLRQSFDYFALLAFIFTSQYHNGIAFS
jgi:hypothetical protein